MAMLAIIGIIISCADEQIDVIKDYSDESMKISVKFLYQNHSNKFLYADLIVKNITHDTVKYTNAGLLLFTEKDSARAYFSSIATMAIDFVEKEIAGGDSLSFDIYFAVEKILHQNEINNSVIVYKHPAEGF